MQLNWRIIVCGNVLTIVLGMLSCTLKTSRPNILFIIADDWSYPHAGVYGDQVVKTPNFDRIANEGILFQNAFVSSPSCTPSRAAILTGQHFWRLQEGGNLYGPLSPEFPVYTNLLEESGYHIGFTNKGWSPGQLGERHRNPAGDHYQSFKEFLRADTKQSPFCFWFGSFNPHRGYVLGSGDSVGIKIDEISVPVCFPNHEIVRNDIADYYKEVQDFDDEIGACLRILDSIGELDNTFIVVTSDNGMPFPRCKSNVYDMGTQVPLAIRWPDQIRPNSNEESLVSLTDLAPTFLEIAGLDIPDKMTGKSLMPFWERNTVVQADRSKVFFGKERHVPSQENGSWEGYPMRSIRTNRFSYIYNFKPDSWPAGTPNYNEATFFPSYYGDVDGGPTRTFMIEHKDQNPENAQLFYLAFGKRPEMELYDLRMDPDQLNNLAYESAYRGILDSLHQILIAELEQTEDPRIVGGTDVFAQDNYTGGTPLPDHIQAATWRYGLEKLEAFPSKYVDPRDIEILFPIRVSSEERYAVLYMMDGQNLFHSFTGWGGELNQGWRVQNILDSIIRAGSIEPIIVVGIYNIGEKRGAEYMPQKPHELVQDRIRNTQHEWYQSFKEVPPQSDDFLKFITEELKPFIDKHYKTKPDQSNTFIGGASYGGMISAYAICEYPDVFGGAACLSTHWPPLDGVFLEYLKSNLPDPSNHKIYFDYGTEGLDAEYEPYQRMADEAMLLKGYTQGVNWVTRKYIGADHNESSWHLRFHVPMEFLLR